MGRGDLIEKTWQMLKHTGGSLDPHACFLLHRGLKTLAVRMRAYNENAMAVAGALDGHPAVSKVFYPGLESSRDHEQAARLFDGFSGMVSFELAEGGDAAKRMMDRVRIPVITPSLGGVESLMARPAMTSHLSLSPEERAERGISDGLVRMSVGIESAGDLVADLEQALAD